MLLGWVLGDMLGVRKLGSRIQIDVSLDASSDHNFWCGLSSDIEQGGLFVATHEPIRLGTVIDLLVHFSDLEQAAVMSGVVRWTRQHVDGSDAPAGVGIKFGPLDDEVCELVHRFADTVREPMLFELDEVPMRPRRTGT